MVIDIFRHNIVLLQSWNAFFRQKVTGQEINDRWSLDTTLYVAFFAFKRSLALHRSLAF